VRVDYIDDLVVDHSLFALRGSTLRCTQKLVQGFFLVLYLHLLLGITTNFMIWGGLTEVILVPWRYRGGCLDCWYGMGIVHHSWIVEQSTLRLLENPLLFQLVHYGIMVFRFMSLVLIKFQLGIWLLQHFFNRLSCGIMGMSFFRSLVRTLRWRDSPLQGSNIADPFPILLINRINRCRLLLLL
jgi:hypothetical protein